MSTLWSGTQTTPTFAYSSSTYSCPTSASVTTISATAYQFCDVIFRNIESPSRLAEWRALPAYAGDVWFASTAPSGSAKETAMSLIKDLTGCAKGVGHTEFGGASPSHALAAFHLPALTRSRLVDRSPCTPRPPLADDQASVASALTSTATSGGCSLTGTHVPFEFLPTDVVTTPVGQQPSRVRPAVSHARSWQGGMISSHAGREGLRLTSALR